MTLPYTQATAMIREDGTVFLNYEVVSEVGIDMPRINYDRYAGRKYRYAFGCANQVTGEFMNTVGSLLSFFFLIAFYFKSTHS